MKNKLRGEAGVTLVEMLASVMLLTMLALMVGAGLGTSMRVYRGVVAQSEAELLLSTAVNALADELRYAWNVVDDEGSPTGWTDFIYNSNSFGDEMRLAYDNGKILVIDINGDKNGENALPFNAGAYGKNAGGLEDCKVNFMEITHDQSSNIFTIKLEITGADGVSARTPEGGVQVRCLNPQPTSTPGGTP